MWVGVLYRALTDADGLNPYSKLKRTSKALSSWLKFSSMWHVKLRANHRGHWAERRVVYWHFTPDTLTSEPFAVHCGHSSISSFVAVLLTICPAQGRGNSNTYIHELKFFNMSRQKDGEGVCKLCRRRWGAQCLTLSWSLRSPLTPEVMGERIGTDLQRGVGGLELWINKQSQESLLT